MTTPLKTLKQAVKILKQLDCKFCLVGGHAASLYRSEERLTKDVDFALVANPAEQSKKVAEACIDKLGLKPMIGFIPRSKAEHERNPICLITSTPTPPNSRGVVDILLPVLPWVPKAVERAQHNQIDLGFSKVPVIPPEDLIIAKCYSLANSPDRFQDLDDLKHIFEDVGELDYDYLRAGLKEFNLVIPAPIKKYAQ